MIERSPKPVFEHMRDLVRADNVTSFEERLGNLQALRHQILAHQDDLKMALNEDFNGRSEHETTLADIIPTIGSIDHTIKHLRKWMRPQRRQVALHFAPAKNRVVLHPKGVVLIISPWNYPVLLSLLPMASALAAGNRVILKPSECAPNTSQVMANIVRDSLPKDRATVLTGGAEISIELCEQPFDHIMFTGSTRVGKMVMQAAAKNLTPVTLELGGKSPAIVQEDYNIEKAATRIARGKLLNAGQTCVAPDYVLLPRKTIPDFISAYKNVVARFYPDIANNSDYTSIINRAQFDRLMALLGDAKDKGALVSVVGAKGLAHSGNRKLHPHIVEQIDESMLMAHEEIFGPILPIVPYDNLEQASAYINQRPHPLALYYFDNNPARVEKFLNATISGGAAVNESVVHFAQDDLPIGGAGESGMGVSHGFEGFKEFSHAKSVFYQSKLNGLALLDPPYSKMFDRIAKFLLR